MTTAVLELNVSGMICRACEDAIADALLHTRGVISAQAHYWRSRVTITYDPDIVTEVKVHCSVLAEQAIKAAVSDYYKRRGVDPEPIVGNVPECDSCGCEG